MKASSLRIGKYYLDRQTKPKGRWKVPGVPAYDPNWVVEFRLPEVRKRESSKLPICERCLKVDGVPAEVRKTCECQVDPRTWADKRLAELVEQWRKGHLEKKPAEKPLMLTEVEEVYLQRGPDGRERNMRHLRMIVEATKGRTFESIRVDELHPDDWDKWAWMYQDYERRKWSKRGGDIEVPADAWAQIRRAMPAHPDPDRESATPGNTTILSRMRDAKSVLGPESRDSYIKPLRDRLPDSVMKWWSTRINIQTADGRFSLSREVYEKMWKGLAKLRTDDPQVWALIRLHWTTGVRPKEARHAKIQWLEVADAGTADEVVMLVVRNRFEDDAQVEGETVKGFRLKDRTTHQARVWPLPNDLVEVIRQIASPAGSMLGCDLDGQWDKIYRRASEWLRACGIQGSQTLYNLRKLVGTVKVAKEGRDAGAAALGHSKSSTTMAYYAGQAAPLKALHDDDLTPESVMGGRRVPFSI